MNKILIIGCGHMGSALLKAWCKNTSYSFAVVDPFEYKKIKKKFNGRVKAYKSENQIADILIYDLILFSIKPQIAEKVLINFKKYKFNSKTIFLSIVAGKRISFFNKYLPNNNKFIRAMPNMPALINMGMTCLVGNKKISPSDKKKIKLLFDVVGKTLWLKSEHQINKVTAISGSGPGYIFLIIDAFVKAALKLGLNSKATQQLVYQTFLGSINLLLKEKKSPKVLANNIAVKGGTTEAGLNELTKHKTLYKIFNRAVRSAYSKANKLGK